MDPVLFVIVGIAFVVEAALGFGATLVTVTIGAFFLDLGPLLAAFVPLNLLMSTILIARAPRAVDVRLLARTVLPFMALGLPIGLVALRTVDEGALKRVFGAFVVALALSSLLSRTGARPLSAWRERALLFVGGVVHGAFATGGPMAVYVIGRRVDEKGAFRATLSGLWLVLNLVLVGVYVESGALDARTLQTSGALVLSLVVGLVVGDVLHRRVPTELFKRLVWILLACGGLALVVRG